MNTSEFKSIVKKAIHELISSEPFLNVAKRNWIDGLGHEEELYPYLTEMIRRQLTCEVQGIGWRRYQNNDKKADCLCYLNIDYKKTIFSVELKGPSKDHAWISSGLNEDIDKLNQLKKKGIINYGIAVGVLLKAKDKYHEKFEEVLNINSSQVGVKVSILETKNTSMDCYLLSKS